MSRLSPSLKALINAPSARPLPTPAPPGIAELYASIARDATSRRVTLRPWLAISAATTFTLNSPESLSALYSLASAQALRGRPGGGANSSGSSGPIDDSVLYAAELMREVGLKCISFNGIPRTINCLNAFRAALPPATAARLCATPSRALTPSNLGARIAGGRRLWDSVYVPFEDKLLAKLALAHPDLPLVILHGTYATLLADPEGQQQEQEGRGQEGQQPVQQRRQSQEGEARQRQTPARLGRALTSLTAIACLRAQGGVAPQVVSHVFGLRKAVDDGTYTAVGPGADAEGDGRAEDESVAWLASDEGAEWVLRTVDRIAEALRGEEGRGVARSRL